MYVIHVELYTGIVDIPILKLYYGLHYCGSLIGCILSENLWNDSAIFTHPKIDSWFYDELMSHFFDLE